MKSLEELEQDIYGNQSAYDIFDDMIQAIIPITINMLMAADEENFEVAIRAKDKVDGIIDETADMMCDIFGKEHKKGLIEVLIFTYNDIVNHIKENEA
jgi:hypothetical protein